MQKISKAFLYIVQYIVPNIYATRQTSDHEETSVDKDANVVIRNPEIKLVVCIFLRY